jgi:uncharacterized protein
MEDILKRIILENIELIRSKKIITRDYHIPAGQNIKILTGIRRCGKTFQLYQNSLTHDPDNVLFLDFEDERLIQLGTLENYDVILDSYRRIFTGRKPVLFFDEIQSLRNWHLYLKRLHAQDYEILVTGSNANLLSSDIATYLTGRAIETHIFPFSFKEFLELKGLSFSPGDFYTRVPEILNIFDDYLINGGFPEVIKAEPGDKRVMMRSIHELILYKDLVAKYEKNHYLFQLIISKLVENIGKAFSLTKLANKIIPVYKTSNPTVTDYVNLLSAPFVVKPVFMYRKSFVHREMERKVYFVDNSFISQNTVERDYARLLENCVFNYLNRYSDEVFYYTTANKLEVDFLCKRGNDFYAVQVSYSISDPSTRNRELKALRRCVREIGLNRGLVLTYNEEGKEIAEGINIDIMPVWKFLLNEPLIQEPLSGEGHSPIRT